MFLDLIVKCECSERLKAEFFLILAKSHRLNAAESALLFADKGTVTDQIETVKAVIGSGNVF